MDNWNHQYMPTNMAGQMIGGYPMPGQQFGVGVNVHTIINEAKEKELLYKQAFDEAIKFLEIDDRKFTLDFVAQDNILNESSEYLIMKFTIYDKNEFDKACNGITRSIMLIKRQDRSPCNIYKDQFYLCGIDTDENEELFKLLNTMGYKINLI